MTHKQIRTLFTFLLLVWCGAVAYLCFGHFEDMDKIPWHLFGIPDDKVVHFCMFLPFPMLAWLAFDRFTTKPWHSVVFVLVVFVVGCILAAATEIGQSFTEYRTGDPADFRVDALAMAICSVIVFVLDVSKQFKKGSEEDELEK